MTEQEIRRSSLADAFKGTGGQRTTGLGDILSQAEGRSTAPVEPAKRPTEVSHAEAAVKPAEPAPKAAEKDSPSGPVPATDDDQRVDSVPAYIDPEVLTAVRIAKRKGVSAGQPELSYDELLLDAIDDLGIDRIREEFNPTQANGDQLVTRRIRRTRGTGGVQIQVRLSRAQQRQLGELEREVGAPSRSALFSTVYRLAYVKQR